MIARENISDHVITIRPRRSLKFHSYSRKCNLFFQFKWYASFSRVLGAKQMRLFILWFQNHNPVVTVAFVLFSCKHRNEHVDPRPKLRDILIIMYLDFKLYHLPKSPIPKQSCSAPTVGSVMSKHKELAPQTPSDPDIFILAPHGTACASQSRQPRLDQYQENLI